MALILWAHAKEDLLSTCDKHDMLEIAKAAVRAASFTVGADGRHILTEVSCLIRCFWRGVCGYSVLYCALYVVLCNILNLARPLHRWIVHAHVRAWESLNSGCDAASTASFIGLQ